MRRLLSLLAVIAASGCGSSSSDSSSSVPPTAGIATSEDGGAKALADLGDSEKKKLCDWTAAEGGGYGKVTTCDAGQITQYKSQADCLARFPGNCTKATVADWEACRLAEVKDLCATIEATPEECGPVEACGPTGGG